MPAASSAIPFPIAPSDSAARFEREHTRCNGIDGVALDFVAATRAESAAGARVEQAQIIVNFGGGGYS